MPGMSRSRRRYSRDDATPLINAVLVLKEDSKKGWTRFEEALTAQTDLDLDETDGDGFTAMVITRCERVGQLWSSRDATAWVSYGHHDRVGQLWSSCDATAGVSYGRHAMRPRESGMVVTRCDRVGHLWSSRDVTAWVSYGHHAMRPRGSAMVITTAWVSYGHHAMRLLESAMVIELNCGWFQTPQYSDSSSQLLSPPVRDLSTCACFSRTMHKPIHSTMLTAPVHPLVDWPVF
ncbi:hypothetical protein ElyMa_002296100 [Elysia marginata]|uniref:Uncharacterized protein n=1 Tax=Elysia marginata TaxID=1093978 RepID=A0AAV4G216_9GAST|nr:hypothetical protein ElyMa_002296100 [Elysia marginata]